MSPDGVIRAIVLDCLVTVGPFVGYGSMGTLDHLVPAPRAASGACQRKLVTCANSLTAPACRESTKFRDRAPTARLCSRTNVAKVCCIMSFFRYSYATC
jgi:hypothetical protein